MQRLFIIYVKEALDFMHLKWKCSKSPNQPGKWLHVYAWILANGIRSYIYLWRSEGSNLQNGEHGKFALVHYFVRGACPFTTTFNEFPACPWHLRNSHPKMVPTAMSVRGSSSNHNGEMEVIAVRVCTSCPDTCFLYCMIDMLEKIIYCRGAVLLLTSSHDKKSS